MSSVKTSRFNESLRGEPKSTDDQMEPPSVSRVPSTLSADEEACVKSVFNSFACRGEINGAKFAKFMRDNKLSGKKLSATDVDLVFAKAKPKGIRVLTYETFRHVALPLAAERRGSDLDKMLRHVCKNGGGPVFAGTKAQAVRHHDDKSLYTGVYGKGGPTNAHDQIEIGNATCGFKSLLDRSSADVRGRQVEVSREEKIEKAHAKSKVAQNAKFVDTSAGAGNVTPRTPPGTNKAEWNSRYNSNSYTGLDDDGGGSISPAAAEVAAAASHITGSIDKTDVEGFLCSLSIPAADAAAYTSKLKEDGFDVISDLKDMSEGDFAEIGMKKGHMRKVMQAAQACP